MFSALEPAMAASRALGGPTLEGLLLARHRVIDELLTQAIEERNVRQVIEPACGMSPRGWRFCARYGEALTYIEGDLPEMTDRKRRALTRMDALGDRHRVIELDVLLDDGPASIARLAAELDPDQGLAIVTEGLLTYLDEQQVIEIWRGFARAMAPFGAGTYLADLRLGGRSGDLVERSFGLALSVVVRGRVHTHFADRSEALAALYQAGFGDARVHRCDQHRAARRNRDDPGARRIHIVEAATA
jgi:O-methyltransferase involved in polyketide biosynthesis